MKRQTVTMKNVRDKKEPSKEAVDQFISIYVETVKENLKKEND